MGQCGCGEFPVTHGFRLPSGVVVAYGVYHGCSYCFAGPAVNVYVYPNHKSEWLEHAKIESYKPDKYGGESGHGIPISFFEVRDLIDAAKEIGNTHMDEEGYVSVEEWLEDNGLQMMQEAMEKFDQRMKRLNETRRKS